MKKVMRFFLGGVVVVVIAIGWNSFFILPEGVLAIITQFGKPIGQPITEAGMYYKVPLIQEVTYFDKKIIIWDGDANQIPTNDKTFVYLDVTARWRIADALTFLQAANNEARAQGLLDDIIDGTVRDLVNKNNLIEIIRSSDWSPASMSAIGAKEDEEKVVKYGRDKLAAMVHEIAAKATRQYGIELIDVMFKRVSYIESVRKKVYDRMISERKRIAAEKRSFGEGQKAEILGRLSKELKEITSEANRQAQEIKGRADAEATRIYGEAYSQDPEFYSFYKTLDTYRETIGVNTKLIISTDSDFYRYLKKIDFSTGQGGRP